MTTALSRTDRRQIETGLRHGWNIPQQLLEKLVELISRYTVNSRIRGIDAVTGDMQTEATVKTPSERSAKSPESSEFRDRKSNGRQSTWEKS